MADDAGPAPTPGTGSAGETSLPLPLRPLKSRAEVAEDSALLHAARAAALRGELDRLNRRRIIGPRSAVRAAAESRVGHRIRFAALIARRTARALREDGIGGTWRLVAARLRPAHAPLVRTQPQRPAVEGHAGAAPDAETIYAAPPRAPAAARLTPRVLIVAELSIPQCAKYRVWQRQAQFERLGMASTVIDWRRPHEARSALQTHTVLILYRVPGEPGILALLDDARRLGVETFWEVDDLVFDVALYGQNANLRTLPRALRRNLLEGAALYRRGLLAADRGIASTPVLAELMTAATGRESFVIENGLDDETIRFAAEARRGAATRDPDRVVIVYGSGTKTHDADFAVAAPALRRLLEEDPRIRLRIVGELTLPPLLSAVTARIDRRPFTGFKAYLADLAVCDISIAPLEDTVFNDAKSNIKLIEATVVGIPSVCSPARAFADAIAHGDDGYLARTEQEWYEALRALADDPQLRARIAARSGTRIHARYGLDAIASSRTAALLADHGRMVRRPLRVLVVNVFFAPRSFGGATIVAEAMAHALHARDDIEVFVFTTHGLTDAAAYELRRYAVGGIDVFGIKAPAGGDPILDYDDPSMGESFADVLRATGPDIIHFHCIQHLGTAMLRAAQAARIPYVVTLHDAWWLCQRQFMVRADNTYCFQTTIDLKLCERCMPGAFQLGTRMDIMLQGLHAAALVLSPSAAHAALYAANGIPAEKLRVNRNGIRAPGAGARATREGPIRFGFVGGNEKLKGIGLIRDAFERLERRDWTLVLVDNTLKLGLSSFPRGAWRLPGRVEIVPPYEADQIDEFFAGIDVLLFPSQWKESFGLTVREALARDVWVIATDAGGAAEEVVEGVNGNVVPLGNDPEPLAAAIRAVLVRGPDAMRRHRNPLKDRIALFPDQAEELASFLHAAARR